MPLLWLEPPWTTHTIIYASINITLLIFQLILKKFSQGKFGVVRNEKGKPVSGVEIGLYDTDYDQLIDKKVTDSKGRYQFVVPGELYYIKPTGSDHILTSGVKDKKGIPVGKKTDEDILIAKNIEVRRT